MIKIKKSHRGILHKELGVPLDEKIPAKKLTKAEKSSSPAERKRASFAKAEKGWDHHGSHSGKTRRRVGA
jgi:hypothetical protein